MCTSVVLKTPADLDSITIATPEMEQNKHLELDPGTSKKFINS